MNTQEGNHGQLQEQAINVAKFMLDLDAIAKSIREAE